MGEKVSFDEINKIINITLAPDANDDIFIDVKIDLYSDGKEDWVSNENLRKFIFPITAVGGNPLPGSKELGSTFFLASDWKIKPYNASHRLTINGNLYSQDGSDPFLNPDGAYTVRIMQQVSSLVDSTVQQLDEIEYASFNGGVTLDSSSPYSGYESTAGIHGTPRLPVNNLTDALLIANLRGFTTIYLNSSLNINNDDLDGFKIIGRNEDVFLTIDTIASVDNLVLQELTITSSVLDGGVDIRGCAVRDVSYVNGHMHNCGLAGTIVLGGNRKSVIADCYTVDQDNPPTIDMGGNGNDLAMPNYSGMITVTNLNSSDNDIGIGLDAGMVVIDSTISAGTIIVSGIGIIIDNSTGTANVNTDGLINKETISAAVLNTNISTFDNPDTVGLTLTKTEYKGVIYIDSINGISGSAYPTGTFESPVDNIVDAMTLAGKYNINCLHFHSDMTISSGIDVSYMLLVGHPSYIAQITLESGIIATDTIFENIKLTGVMSSAVTFNGCFINSVTNLEGYASNCIFNGNCSLADNNTKRFEMHNCRSATQMPVNIVLGACNMAAPNWVGMLQLSGKDDAISDVNVGMTWGYVIIADTCIAGGIFIVGTGLVADYSGVGCTVNSDNVINVDIQTNRIWEHTNALRILGLVQENFKMDQQVYEDYNGANLLTSARIRTYNDAALTDLLATYTVTATWSDGQCISYQMVKV